MRRKTVITVISLCCIVALIILTILISRTRSYPSVFGSSISEATGVEFSVQIQSIDNVQQLACFIINNNDYDIEYGQDFYLEKEKDNEWYEITDKSGKRTDEKSWIAIAYTVPAQVEKATTILLDNFRALSKGNYRIIKKISGGQNMVAFFKVD